MIPDFFWNRRVMVSRNSRFCTIKQTRIDLLVLSRDFMSAPLSLLVTNHPHMAWANAILFLYVTPHRPVCT